MIDCSKNEKVSSAAVDLIRDSLKKVARFPVDRRKTSWGSKTKYGLLQALRRAIEKDTLITETQEIY